MSVTGLDLHRYPDLSGSQHIPRAAKGQFWKVESQEDSSGLDEKLSRLVEKPGYTWSWGAVNGGLPTVYSNPAPLLERTSAAEHSSVPQRNLLAELFPSMETKMLHLMLQSAKGEAPAEMWQSLLALVKSCYLFFVVVVQPYSAPLRECLSKIFFLLSSLRDILARFFCSISVNEDLHPRLVWERDLFGKEFRTVAASTRVGKDNSPNWTG